MKKFNFRLQRVLDFRHSEKKECEQELAQRNYELQTAESTLEYFIEEQDRTLTVAEEPLTMGELLLADDYRARLKEAIESQRLLILDAAKQVDKAREAYVSKAVETEALETLKSRKSEEHEIEQKRKERKDVNEIVIQRHRFQKEAK